MSEDYDRGYREGRASQQAEIHALSQEADALRKVIHDLRDAADLHRVDL